MIKDLVDTDGETVVATKACIIGAGVAGLFLAWKLNSSGIPTVLLESGSQVTDDAPHPLNSVEQLGQDYLGATRGRFRCLGGTSTRWGGQLVPIGFDAMQPRPYLGLPGWPLNREEMFRYLPEVESLFGLETGAYDASDLLALQSEILLPLGDRDIQPSFSKAPAFHRRNVAHLFTDLTNARAGIDIWLNATVTEFDVDRTNGRLNKVTARNTCGRKISVYANNFVVAPGAIEATRLLLALDARQNGAIFQDCQVLGRFFHDHISAPLAEFVPKDRRQFNRAFGHRFVGSTMRNTRLELTHEAQAVDKVASAYAHVAAEVEPGSGFASIRKFLLSRQKHASTDDILRFASLLGHLPYLVKVGFWRAWYNQLYWSDDAMIRFHVVVEQVPHISNCLRLSNECDPLGLPRVAIDWRLRPTECKTFMSYARRFVDFWRRHRLERLAALEWVKPLEDMEKNILSVAGGGDVFHPAGSTRMGVSRHDAVVDTNLRTFALSNLWVASTSVFPSLGSANPTLTLILLSLRLGDHLAKLRH